jgi:hypothetical protein
MIYPTWESEVRETDEHEDDSSELKESIHGHRFETGRLESGPPSETTARFSTSVTPRRVPTERVG